MADAAGREYSDYTVNEQRAYLKGAHDQRLVLEALAEPPEGFVLVPRELAERICQVSHIQQMNLIIPMLRAVISAKATD